MEWQDISTAPKDEDFLVALGNGYVTRGRFINRQYFACDNHGKTRGGENTDPVAWQPLPEPPK